MARIVGVAPQDLFIDLTVNGLPKGTYYPSIRKSGNLSEGALSTGDSFYDLQPIEVNDAANLETTINSIGAKVVDDKDLYSGQAVLHAKLGVNDLIGRSIILSKLKDQVSPIQFVGSLQDLLELGKMINKFAAVVERLFGKKEQMPNPRELLYRVRKEKS